MTIARKQAQSNTVPSSQGEVNTPPTGHLRPLISDEDAIQLEVFRHALDAISKLLEASAANVETHAMDLGQNLLTLAETTKQQTEQIELIANTSSSFEIGHERVSTAEFSQLFTTTLTNLIEFIQMVTEKSVALSSRMNDTTRKLSQLDDLTKRIDKISRQTTLLSLNAMIEAERAEEAGRGFAVVAGEVKKVSAEIQELTVDMHKSIDEMSSGLLSSNQDIQNLAAMDLSTTIAARSKLDLLLKAVIDKNEKLTHVIHSNISSAQQTAQSIKEAVIHMQFQDRNSQYVSNAVSLLNHFSSHVSGYRIQLKGHESSVKQTVEQINQSFNLSEFRYAVLDHLSARRIIAPVSHAVTHKEDDIELF